MESLNRIIIRGVVGSAKTSEVAGRTLVRMSVCTMYCHRDPKDGRVMDMQWFNVAWWPKAGDDFSWAAKGAVAEVEGRVRSQRYADADGRERTVQEVIAASVKNCGSTPFTPEEEPEEEAFA